MTGGNNSFPYSDRDRFRFASSGCRPLSGECTAWTTPSSVRQRPLLRGGGGGGDCPVTIRLLGLLRLPLRRAGCMLAAAARIIVTNMNGDAPSRCGRQVNPPARAARRRRRKRPRGSRGWWARRPPRSSAPQCVAPGRGRRRRPAPDWSRTAPSPRAGRARARRSPRTGSPRRILIVCGVRALGGDVGEEARRTRRGRLDLTPSCATPRASPGVACLRVHRSRGSRATFLVCPSLQRTRRSSKRLDRSRRASRIAMTWTRSVSYR